MRILEQPFPGFYVIAGIRAGDSRGVFVKTFSEQVFRNLGISFEPREEFYSTSHKNVIRGMHFQIPPHDHEKLIYCSRGGFLDVLVDLRIGSPTFQKIFKIELSGENPIFLFLPRGIAHGFLSLKDESSMTYLTSVVHHPESDRGIRWDSISFPWPVRDSIVSDRDKALPKLDDFVSPFTFPKALEPMKPGRALVTGGSGFVGSRLVRRLVAERWTVAAVLRPTSDDRELAPVKSKLTVLRVNEGFDSLAGAVRDFRPDCVFHTAAWTFHDYHPSNAPDLLNANIRFGVDLVEAMLANGVRRLVNTGTSWQHYNGAAYSPVNLYAATKQAFEALIQYYVEARGLQTVTLKLFDTYGEGDPRPKLLNLLASARASGRPLHMSPGEQVIDLVWVEDIARAYLLVTRMFDDGPGFHRSYGLSGEDRMSLKGFLELYREATGFPAAVDLGARPYRNREVITPWCPSETLPGWRPTPNAICAFLANQFR